ncbi:ABC transporter permease [Clostridium drakei]|uniref:ABC transporter permease n=1 Tax=Clostridium drakei TaxID=332101 RepID=A0A2U8DRI6_9CLOT|nr:ABC transporter permease [Clostridium drakei]AWI05377.1 ABC transporter permease [Clostridium drakei]
MSNLLKVEFYKLKTSKIFYLTMFLNLLQGIAVYAFSENFKLMSGKQAFTFILSIQSSLALDILIGIFASDYIVTEFSSGYIKNLISYGHKRIDIFVSKSIVYYIGIIVITFIPALVLSSINTKVNGYGEIFNLYSIIFLIKLFLIIMIIYIAIGSIFVLTAFISRNANITIIVIVFLDFANRILDIIAVQKKSLEWIFYKSIFAQPGIVLSDKATTSEILQAVLISVVIIVVTTVVGIYVFNKSDIK